MNSDRTWKDLLARTKVDGQLKPVTEKELKAFEKSMAIALPESYRDFCKVFGPGHLSAQVSIHLTAPGGAQSSSLDVGPSRKQNIEVLNQEIWTTSLMDVDEYCATPELPQNGLFFACDTYTHNYFWHKADPTDKRKNEMAIYVIFREFTIHRLADTFESFIFDVCLDRGLPDHGKLECDPPEFTPAD
jgi:hypothetical protein